jgi:hypothetical protein
MGIENEEIVKKITNLCYRSPNRGSSIEKLVLILCKFAAMLSVVCQFNDFAEQIRRSVYAQE